MSSTGSHSKGTAPKVFYFGRDIDGDPSRVTSPRWVEVSGQGYVDWPLFSPGRFVDADGRTPTRQGPGPKINRGDGRRGSSSPNGEAVRPVTTPSVVDVWGPKDTRGCGFTYGDFSSNACGDVLSAGIRQPPPEQDEGTVSTFAACGRDSRFLFPYVSARTVDRYAALNYAGTFRIKRNYLTLGKTGSIKDT